MLDCLYIKKALEFTINLTWTTKTTTIQDSRAKYTPCGYFKSTIITGYTRYCG